MINEERISKLTSAIYKVTDLFADKEPLKFSIRRVSLDVLSLYISFSETSSFESKRQFAQKGEVQSKILLKYLNLAESQDWINPANFEILKGEYWEVNYWFSEQFIKIKSSLENRRKPQEKQVDPALEASFEEQPSLRLSSENKEMKPTDDYSHEQLAKRLSLITKDQQTEVLQGTLGKIVPQKQPLFLRKNSADISSEVINKEEKEIKPNDYLYNMGAALNYEELSSVQLKILEILQANKFLKSSNICHYFEGISDRNIRREIKELKDKSIIITKGTGRSTYYQLNYIY